MDFNENNFQLQYEMTPAVLDRAVKGELPACQAPRLGVLEVDTLKTRIKCVPGISVPFEGMIRGEGVTYLRSPDGPVPNERLIRLAQKIKAVAIILEKASSRWRIVAYTGSGNTGQNLGCVYYKGGKLISNVLSGPRHLLPYDCLVLWKSGRLSVESVTFLANGGRWHATIDGKNVSSEIRFALSGQRLVKGGKVVDPYADFAAALDWADMRHLLRFAWVETTEGFLDFGLGELTRDHDTYRRALAGEAVELRLGAVSPEVLAKALNEKGYRSVSSSELSGVAAERGLYCLPSSNSASSKVRIVFHRAVYPHHCLALREDKPTKLWDIVMGGWSNNSGTNPLMLAADLRRADFTDAINLDQGGDNLMVVRHRRVTAEFSNPNGAAAIITSSLGRELWAMLIAYCSDNADTFFEDSGIGLDVANGEPMAKLVLKVRGSDRTDFQDCP